MRKLSFILVVGLFVSCNNNQLCDCIDAGDQVNKLSASFFNRTPTQEGKDSLDASIKKRDVICASFQEMMPKELNKKALDCEALKILPEQ